MEWMHMRPPALAASALVALFLLSVLAVPPARAQAMPAGTVSGFSVQTVDLNGNGRYDRLVATFSFNVSVPGNFQFQASLAQVGALSPFLFNSTDANLAVGTHLLTASIAGPFISRSGVNGPYDFHMITTPVSDQGAMGFANPPNDATVSLNATDFDPTWATILAGQITSAGLDTNGNGLYDYLVVHVPLQVNASGPVLVSGWLGLYYRGIPSVTQEPAPLTAGPRTWDLRFDGRAIRFWPSLVGGWTVTISLDLGFLGTTETVTYTPQGYSPFQFEGPTMALRGTPTVTTPDPDGDGAPDYASVHIPLHINASGDFYLYGEIFGPLNTTNPTYLTSVRILSLPAGDTGANLTFSGIALSRLSPGVGFRFAFELLRIEPVISDAFIAQATLNDLSTTAFPQVPPATLQVVGPDCGSPYYCSVGAVDPSHKFLASGGGSVTLYDGTFTVIIQGLNGTQVQSVRVSGNTVVTAALSQAPAPSTKLDAQVMSWNETDVVATVGLGYASSVYRILADVYGDFDGSASAAELAHVATIGFLTDSQDPLTVTIDNRTMPQEPTKVLSVDGAGPTPSTALVSIQMSFVHRSAYPPTSGLHHTLVLDSVYPYQSVLSPLPQVEVGVELANGATGNLTAVSYLRDLTGLGGFTFPANATVSSRGNGAWTVQLGGTPAGQNPSVTFRIVVNAIGPEANPLLTAVLLGILIGAPLLALGIAIYVITRRRRKKAQEPPKPRS